MGEIRKSERSNRSTNLMEWRESIENSKKQTINNYDGGERKQENSKRNQQI